MPSAPLAAACLTVLERPPPSVGAELNCPRNVPLGRWALQLVSPRGHSWRCPRCQEGSGNWCLSLPLAVHFHVYLDLGKKP